MSDEYNRKIQQYLDGIYRETEMKALNDAIGTAQEVFCKASVRITDINDIVEDLYQSIIDVFFVFGIGIGKFSAQALRCEAESN